MATRMRSVPRNRMGGAGSVSRAIALSGARGCAGSDDGVGTARVPKAASETGCAAACCAKGDRAACDGPARLSDRGNRSHVPGGVNGAEAGAGATCIPEKPSADPPAADPEGETAAGEIPADDVASNLANGIVTVVARVMIGSLSVDGAGCVNATTDVVTDRTAPFVSVATEKSNAGPDGATGAAIPAGAGNTIGPPRPAGRLALGPPPGLT